MRGSSELPIGSCFRFGPENPNEAPDISSSCLDLFVGRVRRCRCTDERKALSEQFEVEPD